MCVCVYLCVCVYRGQHVEPEGTLLSRSIKVLDQRTKPRLPWNIRTIIFFLLEVMALFIYFNWRLITTLWWFLPYIHMNHPWVYMCSPSWTPLPPPYLYHPSGSSQCTSPKHPVSCIKPGLVICFLYDIIHISMPFSQIIPSSPSPTESKRLFYTSVSFLLSRIQGYRYHLSKFHIYACFSFWLTSLCIIGSSFIHFIRTDSNVFFLMSE